MAVKMEMDNLLLSTESRPYARIPDPGSERQEPTITNRRRVINGVILSATILAGAVLWQVIDGQGSQPASAELDGGTATIGSAAVQPTEGRP